MVNAQDILDTVAQKVFLRSFDELSIDQQTLLALICKETIEKVSQHFGEDVKEANG